MVDDGSIMGLVWRLGLVQPGEIFLGFLMIRPTTPDDTEALVALTVATGVFSADEAGFLDKMFADYFSRNINEGHLCVTDEAGEPRGVAYYSPAMATDGTWYLLLIAVRPDCQGHGHGKALLQYVEEDLRASGQRVLLVETSGLPSFERTRTFYANCGYEEEARVRDFYVAGDDMVLFRKALN